MVVVATVVLLAVPAGASLPRPATAATVVVDPAACRAPAAGAVCRAADAVRLVRDGGTVVLRRGTHTGGLDLRDRSGVVVRGEPGAVLDAGSGRFALAVRGARTVEVRDLVLRGGSAQTVWVDGGSGVVLRRVQVTGSRGAGVQVRRSTGFALLDSSVRGAASAGVMELEGVRSSRYERLVVDRNGRGPAAFDGDGLQLAGDGVLVHDVVVTGSGSSPRFEHGVYVSARARGVQLQKLRVSGSSGRAVKLQGSGVLRDSVLADDGAALYCGPTAGAGWSAAATRLTGSPRVQREAGCRLSGV